ncbi:MAG: DUF255 domain-containing protein [Methylococcaceae bacterium]
MPIHAETNYPPELSKRLQEALKKQGTDYKPRTEWLLPDGQPKYTNRLILEDSPYLIQHAHNPVDWHAWSEEAFAKAKVENKPIFLSIGYSTCHWCHVMERESFDNEAIAKILNERFISIKVDREQRPDVDTYYMTGVMLITGRGGWPMSNFLMPDGRPFYGGTYFPPEQFVQLLEQINNLWQSEQKNLHAEADRLASAIAQINSTKNKAQKIDRNVINSAVNTILEGYDNEQGGFTPAPKFPNEPYLFLLLRQMERGTDLSLTNSVNYTLHAMAQGGLYDQIGGGFHRYSTDTDWLIPHFEKMLYNQGHLARIYLQAYQQSGRPIYERVVRQTLDYLLREMQAPDGGFYSATDADSEGEEGLFFVWQQEQITSTLPAELAKLAIDLFGVTKGGNFEGRNILNLPESLNEYAVAHKQKLPELFEQVDKISASLRQVREKRIHPIRDDKVVTAWNGMVIAALAEAGRALSHEAYLEAAKKAAEFLWQRNRTTSGRLYRAYLNGTASVNGVQEDYAYFAEALLRLYDTTGEPSWLQKAELLTDKMLEDFWDQDQGGFFMTGQSEIAPKMQRLKEVNDGAIPSGNSVAVRVLAELYQRTGKEHYQDKALATISAFSEKVMAHPSAYGYLLLGVDQLLSGETGAIQYAARGAVSVKGALEADGDNGYGLSIDLTIKPGWHVNAHIPLQKDLIATDVALGEKATGWQLESVIYPDPLQKKMSFQQTELALYEGSVQLRGKVKKDNKNDMLLPLQVTLQACNDQHCLAPEKLNINLSAVTSNK